MARMFFVVLALGLLHCGLGNEVFNAEVDVGPILKSLARQNFYKKVINGINLQINVYLNTSYVYTAMSNHFDRDVVALPGFSHHFRKAAEFHREKAESLMKYMNKRGGKVELGKIDAPMRQEWPNGLEALQDALDIEQDVYRSVMHLHQIADAPKKRDPDSHFVTELEDIYMHDQIHLIKQRADDITELTRALSHASPGLGEFIFDQKLR